MKITHKVIILVILLVIVFSLVGCDDNTKNEVGTAVNVQSELFIEDVGTAWDDSGLDTAAGTIDNILVGGITGQDYTQ